MPILDGLGMAQAHSSITLAKKKKNLFETAKGEDSFHSKPLAPEMLEHSVGSSTISMWKSV